MTILRTKIGPISFDTLSQGLILFAGTSAVSLLNYLNHVVLSRMLGPQEYATLAVLLSLFATLSVPLGAAQAMLADYVARFRARGELGQVARLSRSTLQWLALASLPAAALVALISWPLAGFLQLNSITPILVLSTALLTALLNPALSGILQGLERFWLLGLVLFVGAAVRLVAAVFLVWLGWGASGGIAGLTLAGVVSIALGFFALGRLLWQPGEAYQLTVSTMGRYGGSIVVNSLLFTALINLDVVLVKHYFSPEFAGYYAAAATVGKMVFFMPAAVGTFMFPRVSARLAAGGDGAMVLRKSALITLGLCGAMSVVLLLLPGPITRILFGSAFAGTASLVGAYSLVMTLFALANLQMLYHLSAHVNRFAILLGAGLVLELAGVSLFHQQLSQVILVAGVSIGAVVLVSELWLKGLTGQKRP